VRNEAYPKYDDKSKRIAFAVSLVFHAISLILFLLEGAPASVPDRWSWQFYTLLGISALLSAILPLIQANFKILLVLTVKAMCILLIGIPFFGNISVELTLLIALVIEAVTNAGALIGMFFSVLALTLSLWTQQPMKLWGVAQSGDPLSRIIFIATYILTLTTLMVIIRRHKEMYISRTELANRLHESTLRLVEFNLQLQEYAATAKELALRNERERVSREVHDTLTYTLTNLKMMMEAGLRMERASGSGVFEKLFEDALNQTSDGLRELKRVIRALRQLSVDKTNSLARILHLVRAFSDATDIDVSLHFGDAPMNFTEMADYAIYRIIQESLTNAVRHGKANKISIQFHRQDGGISMTVEDNGYGSENFEEGYGLSGMRERVEKLGGWMKVASGVQEGFMINLWLPLTEERQHGTNQNTAG
jgi:signal transduction histidine kinase